MDGYLSNRKRIGGVVERTGIPLELVPGSNVCFIAQARADSAKPWPGSLKISTLSGFPVSDTTTRSTTKAESILA